MSSNESPSHTKEPSSLKVPRASAADDLWSRSALDSPHALLVGFCHASKGPVIAACNLAFERMTGHGLVAISGRQPSDILGAPSTEGEWTDISRKLAEGLTFDRPLEVRMGNGGLLSVTLHGYPLLRYVPGDVHWALAIVEAPPPSPGFARGEGEHLDSLGTLAGGIAHDFNNLLAIILGYSSLLRQVGTDQTRIAEYSDVITDAARRGADIVKQLMVFANQHEPVLVEMDAHSVLGDALVRCTAGWPDSVHINYDFSAHRSKIMLDPEQMGNALEHVLRNARESIRGGGRITIRTRDRGPLPAHNPALEWLEIQVEDDGCGMDAATKARMFEPFFARNKGTDVRGIGLALVYGIVRAHRGHIEVWSEPERGTRISLLLPRAASGEPAAWPDHVVSESYRLEPAVGILLVEDEPDLGRLWAALFARQGWDLHWASNAEEALVLFEQNGEQIDIVFSDIGLPGKLDGWELCAQIRAIRPNIPLVVASGYFRPNEAGQVHLAEPVAFIQKPYPLPEALERITALVKAKR